MFRSQSYASLYFPYAWNTMSRGERVLRPTYLAEEEPYQHRLKFAYDPVTLIPVQSDAKIMLLASPSKSLP